MQANEFTYRHLPFGAAAVSWVVMAGVIVFYLVTDRPLTWEGSQCGLILFVAVNALWLSTACCRRCCDRVICELAENRRWSTVSADRVIRQQPDAQSIAAWAVKELDGDEPPPGVVRMDRR